VTLQRIVFDDWVPKKLEIELLVPEGDGQFIDFEKYRSTTQGQLAEGELGTPLLADGEAEPDLDRALLNQIVQLGIPENAAKHALFKTGNNNADMAVSWYFENMSDPSLTQPLIVKKSQQAEKAVPQESLDMLVSMGFPEAKCRKALKKNGMSTERATEWLLTNAEAPDSDDEGANIDGLPPEQINAQYRCDKPGAYRL